MPFVSGPNQMATKPTIKNKERAAATLRID
jgi:hypothetical protein